MRHTCHSPQAGVCHASVGMHVRTAWTLLTPLRLKSNNSSIPTRVLTSPPPPPPPLPPPTSIHPHRDGSRLPQLWTRPNQIRLLRPSRRRRPASSRYGIGIGNSTNLPVANNIDGAWALTRYCTDLPVLPGQVYALHRLPMDSHGHRVLALRHADSLRTRLVHWYGAIHRKHNIHFAPLTLRHSRLRSRHLPSEPLPRLHYPQIRPLPRRRHRYGRWRTCRTIFPAHEERSGIQAIRAQTTRVQILALGDKSGGFELCMQLE